MGICSEVSYTKIVTLDNCIIENNFDSREEALKYLLMSTADITYKEASVIDYNTGSVVISMRNIK